MYGQLQCHGAVASLGGAELLHLRAVCLHICHRETVCIVAVALAEYGLQRSSFVGMHRQVQAHDAVAAVCGLQVQRVDTAALLIQQVEAVGRVAVAGADGGFEVGLFVRVHGHMQRHRAVATVVALQLLCIAAVALHVGYRKALLIVAAALHHAGIEFGVVRFIHCKTQHNGAVATVAGSKGNVVYPRSRQHAVAIAVGQHIVAQRHGIVVAIGGLHH